MKLARSNIMSRTIDKERGDFLAQPQCTLNRLGDPSGFRRLTSIGQ